MGWTVAIVMIAVVFSVFIALQVMSNRESGAGDGPPFLGDEASGQAQSHWHSYVGVNICGEWLANQPTFENPVGTPEGTRTAGVHTHGDGLIHTHPFVQSEAGTNATVGKFADYADWSLSADSIDAWTGPASKPDQTAWSNGDTCTFGDFKGQEGRLVWAVDGKVKNGDPADYHQQNGETIVVAFLPKGTDVPFPPGACAAFPAITDGEFGGYSKASPCLEQATTTTAPPSESTTTTAPPG